MKLSAPQRRVLATIALFTDRPEGGCGQSGTQEAAAKWLLARKLIEAPRSHPVTGSPIYSITPKGRAALEQPGEPALP